MATLIVACPICLQKIRAPANVIGRQIRCPQCKNGFTAADPNAVSAEPIAPVLPRPRQDVIATPLAADPLGLDSGDLDVTLESSGSGRGADFFTLRRMIAPHILTGLFWFGVAVFLLVGLIYAMVTIAGLATRSVPIRVGLLSILLDFVITVVALVLWRVVCEALATLFRLADHVREIAEQLRPK